MLAPPGKHLCVSALVLFCAAMRAVAHSDDQIHIHAGEDSCVVTDGPQTFDLTKLRRVDRMYQLSDSTPDHTQSYYFDICARSDEVASTECVNRTDNTKLAVYGCQIAYGRPGIISLGNSQTIETYSAGDAGVPSFAGASGVHVNISGGDPCHNGDIRQLDLWLRCNPDAGIGQPVVPNNGIETDHCEYDVIWESSYGCRACTHDDYIGHVVDPTPIAGLDGCRPDGNWTIYYQKKAGVQCANGVHGGVMTTHEQNEFCTDCPTGFKKENIFQDFYECNACPAGTTSTTRNAATCTPCTGDNFADVAGSDMCYPCGHGTAANTEHTGCVFTSGANCRYISTSNAGLAKTYELDRLANYDHMWEVSEQGGWDHRYFLNLCTQSHVNHACYDGNNDPLISYSCQIPSGSSKAKDLGDTIGFTELSAQELAIYPEGGIKVQLTRGDVCHHTGANARRETDIIVACNTSIGAGQPEKPPGSGVWPWNPRGQVEPDGGCGYQFLWKSRYGCPLCSLPPNGQSSSGTYTKKSDTCDPNTGYLVPTYERVTPCIGDPKTGRLETPFAEPINGPEVYQDAAAQTLCTPDCPAGTEPQRTTVVGGERTICVACPKGQASSGGSAACVRCAGNTYSYKEGSEECIPCGAGTTANSVHNECDLHDCLFDVAGGKYDLKSLDKELSVKDAMYGPIRDVNSNNGHLYFINVCSRQQADGFSCATNEHSKIQSFVCQTTNNLVDSGSHYEGKNLGDTMGVEAAKDGNGLAVIMTHGTKCSNGDVRKTTIDMICDEGAGAGYPVSFEGSAEHGHCQYRFEWKSLNACPVCTEAHYTQIVGECTEDSNGAYTQLTEMVKQTSCNHLSKSAYQPPADSTSSCSQKQAAGGGGGGDSPWYKSPGFLITIIVLSSTLFAVVITFALVKYYKVRRLYEAYAQLDKDRGGNDDFNTIGTLELEDQGGFSQKEDHVGL